MVIRLVVAGVAGRMGSRIADLALQDKGFKVIYGLEAMAKEDAILPREFPTGLDADQIKNADVVIEFTIAAATTVAIRPKIEKYKVPWIIGTTGHTSEQEEGIACIAKIVPVVKSSNMSLGVNAFFKAAQNIAKALPGYSVRIEEAHHTHKKDAPSGTALQVGKLIEKVTLKKVTDYKSKRDGEIVGDHRIIFTGPEDRVELFHHAESRDIFAVGALQAAKWVVNQKPGLYTMQDVLGLND